VLFRSWTVAYAPSAVGQIRSPIELSPKNTAADSGELTLKVSGRHFTRDLEILWNGHPRVTSFIDSRTLKAIIPSDDLAKPGLAQVSVADKHSGAEISEEAVFLTYVPLRANDLIPDAQGERVYVSVSQQDPNGPSLAILDPQKGFVERYVLLPSEPGVLAISDDSRYLYVALEDRVRRMDLSEATGDLDILASSFPQGLQGAIVSMLPLPGQGSSVLISVGEPGYYQTYVFDDAQRRPNYTYAGACLVGAPDDSTVYGNSQFTLYVFSLGSDGIKSSPKEIRGILGGPSCAVYASGALYDGAGDIVNPSGPSVLGRFGAWGLVRPVPELNRTYFVGTDSAPRTSNPSTRLMVFDSATQQLLQALSLPITMAF